MTVCTSSMIEQCRDQRLPSVTAGRGQSMGNADKNWAFAVAGSVAAVGGGDVSRPGSKVG